MLTLRPYQQKAVQDVRQTYMAGLRAPLLVLPTGGGKTVVFCHIAATTAARGKRALILVHRKELLEQTSKALHKSSVYHGLINPQFSADYTAPVQVASVQTLTNRLDKLPAPDLIIIDEAHHATAGSWRKIIDTWPNALILGVTATPVRGDGKGLGKDFGGVFDAIVIGPQVTDLIGLGYLVQPIVYAPREQLDLSDVAIKMGDYDRGQIEAKVDKKSITGDAVDHYQRLCPGVPGVAFCVSIRHAEHVAEQFRSAGYRAFSVDGAMDKDRRTQLLNGLGNGTVDIITSCDLISEGTDIPAIGCAILLRPTKSLGLYLQQVGRALRPCAGKDRAIILDHVGNVLEHGMPTEAREWELAGEIKAKKKNKALKPPPKVLQCKSCFAVHEPAPKCPQCGYEYEVISKPIVVKDGNLEELTAEQAALMRKQKSRQLSSEVGRARTLEELEAIARARGYKPGWARHVFESRQKRIVVQTLDDAI